MFGDGREANVQFVRVIFGAEIECRPHFGY